MNYVRPDGREKNQLRDITIKKGILKYPTGSCEITAGDTKILVAVKMEDVIPSFLQGHNSGWISATYNLLPGSCDQRIRRDKIQSRSLEIQRLIGRSLRQAVNMKLLPAQTFWVDCDVIQADGGTRTMCITAGVIALIDAFENLKKEALILDWPLKEYLAAISVGIVENEIVTDLNFAEDCCAYVDMNIVMTESGNIVEIQGTAENGTFSQVQLFDMVEQSKMAIENIIHLQKKTVNG